MGHSSSQLIWSRYTNMIGTTAALAAEWFAITPQTFTISHTKRV